jgi:hypothetical protein
VKQLGSITIPEGATSGKLAVSDANGKLQWKTLAEAGVLPAAFAHRSGSWYFPWLFDSASAPGTSAFTAGRLLFVPIWVDAAWSIDRVGFYLSTVAASSSVRIGIYNAGSNGAPGSLLVDFGTVATAVGTGEKTITVSQTLQPGMYWLAMAAQGGNPTLYRYWVSPVGIPNPGPATVPGNNNLSPPMQDSVTGALPDPATPVYTNTGAQFPAIQFRTA